MAQETACFDYIGLRKINEYNPIYSDGTAETNVEQRL